MSTPAPRLFLVDAFGLIFRAFYGRARAAVPSMRTSAGVPTEAAYVFTTMIRKLVNDHKPDYLAVVWEGEGPTFRDEVFPEYKANRDETPDDLLTQLPLIRRILDAMRTPVLAEAGYEADDTIGSLAHQAAEHEIDVYVVSSDKDLMQLVGGRTYFLNPMKNDIVYDSDGVKEFIGVEPRQVIDLLALKGDPVDNIPGAPGIGDKGAKQLIEEYGSVEAAMEHAEEIKRKTYRESLQNNREQILLSKRLATIALDAPAKLTLEDLETVDPDPKALREIFTELEFHSLISQLGVPADQGDTESATFESADEVQQWLASLPTETSVAIWPAFSAADEVTPGGLAFCAEPPKARMLPEDLLDAAKAFLEDAARPKRVHDGKSTLHRLHSRGIRLRGVVDDTMLAAFLSDSSRTDYSLDKTVARKMAAQLDGDPCHAVDMIARLGETLATDLERMELRPVYDDIELPLTEVLAEMERAGVLLDRSLLEAQSAEMQVEVDALNAEICAIAGREFNVNSTKQLGEVLFDELGLPAPARRGKTKARSTASDVLEHLAEEHPIARKILDYRQFAKLKSTYVDALPNLISPQTGRLHTTFNPTGSATGRLSSSNPNLQNIPVRTEEGRRIRAAFIAPEGKTLVAADYSQVELRVLAHISADPALRDAFQKGEDIHTRTAAEVFGIPPLAVGKEERRRAKAVNFGIVYGLSPFGLSQQLGIPQKESKAYIEAYFELYTGVRKYMDKTIAQARRSGFVKTLFGRRRPIPDLDSRNPAARGFAERTAINTPIQGTAADLIKIAMIRVDKRVRREGLRSTMLLQVHDELLFEAPVEEAEALGKLVKQEMEAAHQLSVPLIADVKAGPNWRDMDTRL